MDVRYQHGTNIHVVRTYYHEDGADLVAVGGDHSVDVLRITGNGYELVATFHVGARITAIAWSPRSISPSHSDEWVYELTASTRDNTIYLLNKTYESSEFIFQFGGGLSGHRARVNDMAFCGGQGPDAGRYVASVSDDKFLLVWDLTPDADLDAPSRQGSMDLATPPPPKPRCVPLAFPHALSSLDAHPRSAKDLLVGDVRGNVYLTDWRTDAGADAVRAGPPAPHGSRARHASVLELVDPSALTGAVGGTRLPRGTGSVSWRRDPMNIVGAVYGSRFSTWDLNALHGGKPQMSGPSFPEGGARFRWCPTMPGLFALSASSPTVGPLLRVYDGAHGASEHTDFMLAAKPLRVGDFDWLGARGKSPQIAAALGRELVVFAVSRDDA